MVKVNEVVRVNVDDVVDVVLCVDVVTTASHVAPSNCAGQLQLNAFGNACACGHTDATQNAASENSRDPTLVTVP